MPYVKLKDVEIHYQERGNGAALVLLHAFPFHSGMWRHQLEALSDRSRVIAIDLRGFGGSRYEEPFTIERLARDVHEVLDALGALPCVMVGASMGGFVTLEYADRYLDTLSGMVLLGTRASGESRKEMTQRIKIVDDIARKGKEAHIQSMLQNALARSKARNIARKIIPLSLQKENDPLMREVEAIMEECPTETMINGVLAILRRPDHRDDLSRMQVPALVAVGEGDQITPVKFSKEMHDRLPDSRLAEIPDSGHAVPLEQPEETNRILREFLAELGITDGKAPPEPGGLRSA